MFSELTRRVGLTLFFFDFQIPDFLDNHPEMHAPFYELIDLDCHDDIMIVRTRHVSS